jgi:hypothetical protein
MCVSFPEGPIVLNSSVIDDGGGKEEWTDEKRSRTKNFHHGGVGNDFTTFVPHFPASGQQSLLGKQIYIT